MSADAAATERRGWRRVTSGGGGAPLRLTRGRAACGGPLLAGKTSLILGVANKWSLAYAIAKAFRREILGLRDRAILELLYASALRNSELLALTLADVHFERNIMARNLLMHTCADRERALATSSPDAQHSWRAASFGLIDAIVGLWLAPVTPHE